MIDLFYLVIDFIVFLIFAIGITVGFFGWIDLIIAKKVQKREENLNDKTVDDTNKHPLF